MVAIGIIAALIVMYVLSAPKEAPRDYETYRTMEYVADRRHNNRVWYLEYR
jgi:hypothetical protein